VGLYKDDKGAVVGFTVLNFIKRFEQVRGSGGILEIFLWLSWTLLYMDDALLKEIINKLDRLDEKITNFLGFFDLEPEDEIALRKDIEAYQRGELETVSLEEAEDLV
jgi:hypothetical protein